MFFPDVSTTVSIQARLSILSAQIEPCQLAWQNTLQTQGQHANCSVGGQVLPSPALADEQCGSSCLETLERMGIRHGKSDKSLSETGQLLEFTESSLKGRDRVYQEDRKVGHSKQEQRQHDLRQYAIPRYTLIRASAERRTMLRS
jgi:hypothetical protein